MSYIIKSTNPFIRVKLTETGRQKLATGQLTFSKWAVGDSEIDYGYVAPNQPGVDAEILRPKDQQPNLRYYLTTNTGDIKVNLTNNDIRVLGITVNNPADQRGFFNGTVTSGVTTGWTIQTSSQYIKATGTLSCALFNGGNTINLGTSVGPCDFVQFIFTNPTLGTLSPQSFANEPVPYLWYKIVSGLTVGTTVTLDRNLPNLASGVLGVCSASTQIQFIVYPGCDDPINTFYGSACTTSYWNTGTLTFDSSCEISIADVLVWNQNNVWCENIIGTQSTDKGHEYYGSVDFIGQKNYLGFPCDCLSGASANICDSTGQSYEDTFQKGIGILHYTNNTISNFYGEFFYIDTTRDKNLIIDLPTLMWHNRLFTGGSGTGDEIGMRFVSSGILKTVTNTNIKYYDLVEDPFLTGTPDSPITVGRVYPQLKIVVISDEELLAAMSYKSNRNWTLPKLKATLNPPSGSTSSGLLQPGETLFLTYALDPTSGFGASLPCQKYIKITNTSSTSKDVYFTFEGLGLLPYMREIESSWDGLGFYAHELVLLSQKVTDSECRPDPALWRETVWTDPSSGTLNPLEIENQNPAVNDFLLTGARYSAGTYYNLSFLNVPLTNETNIMNFGDERFFYGNLNTYIGAKLFKTIFSLNVDRNQFTTTSNPTYGTSNNSVLKISEIGIYDNVGDLVLIGKISTPVSLPTGSVANIEMTLDF